MNLRSDQQPFSVSEFVVGGTALVAIVLIASIGLRVSQPDVPPAGASANASSVSRVSSASTPSRDIQPAGDGLIRATQSSQGPYGVDLLREVQPSRWDRANVLREVEPSEGLDGANVVRTAPPVRAAPPLRGLGGRGETRAIEPLQAPDRGNAPAQREPPAPSRLAFASPSEPAQLPREPAQQAREPAVRQSPGTTRNPANRADAMWIQDKLHELGYFSAHATGVWGVTSRSALRDFKIVNGLQPDDRWDAETERMLQSDTVIRAADTFIGSWASEADACQLSQGSLLVITSQAAKTDGGECAFRSVKPEPERRWRVAATCSAEGNSWASHIQLKLSTPNLDWSSERGSATYVRCVNH